jgi:N-methylhydantoinase B
VVLEIIRGSLRSTVKEMELLTERGAMSPFIKEKKDYFVGIYDTRSRIVCCHISSSGPGMVAPILETYELEDMCPGDVYWFNDPYISKGAVQHHQDMVFAEQYAIRSNSGGPGLYRGGCGVIRDVRVLCDQAELGTRMQWPADGPGVREKSS